MAEFGFRNKDPASHTEIRNPQSLSCIPNDFPLTSNRPHARARFTQPRVARALPPGPENGTGLIFGPNN